MARPGWKATGLLEPLWTAYPGGAKGLADAAGTSDKSLYSINSGKRPLGLDLARRLASALKITVFDLGAPEWAARTQEERRVIDRLREVEAALEALGPSLELVAIRVSALERRDQPRTRGGRPR